jgi:hypothetical protein
VLALNDPNVSLKTILHMIVLMILLLGTFLERKLGAGFIDRRYLRDGELQEAPVPFELECRL